MDRLGRNLGGHVPNIGNAITPLKMSRLGRLLGGLVQATPLLQNRFLGIWSLLLTAQGTFWFYGM